MNTLLYIMETFTNSGKPWEQQEDDQLNTLYNVDILDIMAISKIHKRTPGGIIFVNCIIPRTMNERGQHKFLQQHLQQNLQRHHRHHQRHHHRHHHRQFFSPFL